MKNHSIKISREADIMIENWRFKARERFQKSIPKKEIIHFLISQATENKKIQRKFWDWAKQYCK